MGSSDPRCRIVAMATNALKNKLKNSITSLSLPRTPRQWEEIKVLLRLQGEKAREVVAKFKSNGSKIFPCTLPLVKYGTCPAFIPTKKKQTAGEHISDKHYMLDQTVP